MKATGEVFTNRSSRDLLLSLGSRDLARPRMQLPDESISVRMAELGEGDEGRLRRVYRFVRQVHDFLRSRLTEPEAIDELAKRLSADGFAAAHADAGQLGRGVARRGLDARLRKAYHDIRGGSLLSLLMHLEMVELGHSTDEDAMRIFVLARDQLKIMRNAVFDLDPVRRDADLQDKDHEVSLLREKWASITYRLPEQQVAVDLDCEFEGVIASCCMEFSTLDRVIYNLVNNAARHSTDGTVGLSVLPLDDQPETLLRIAISDRVDEDHRRTLAERFGDDLAQMFRGGFSTAGEGHGLGLRICADLVTHGFSLPSVPFAVDHGYLGAKLLDDRFFVWFHWPAKATSKLAAS